MLVQISRARVKVPEYVVYLPCSRATDLISDVNHPRWRSVDTHMSMAAGLAAEGRMDVKKFSVCVFRSKISYYAHVHVYYSL